MNPATRYYTYLERKCLESDKYTSLNEMRGQALPWMVATLALVLVAVWLFPNGSIASDVLLGLALALWFGGLGFVTLAFMRAARKRQKINAEAGDGGPF